MYKIIAQAKPGAATDTDLYTVPDGMESVITVMVCNQSGADTIRIAAAPEGASAGDTQYLVYNRAIAANDTYTLTKITIQETDIIRVYSTNGTCSFTVFGIEKPI